MASITERVKELSRSSLLEEAGTTESDRGRRQVLLRLNPQSGFVVGVEFDADHIIGVVVDMEARVIARSRRILPREQRKDPIIQGIVETIDDVLRQLGGREKIRGIGVADPGLVDSRRGMAVLSTTIKEWRDVPVKEILESRFGLPVTMDENTRAKALYENRFGSGRNVRNLMFIEFGSGIGCGIIHQGELYRGSCDSAGELGHMRVMENGPVCNCGSYGCLEAVASLPAIAFRSAKAIREGANSMILDLAAGQIERIAPEHVFAAARQGDKLALGIIDEAVKYLGIGIANAINLLNPEMVVFDPRLGEVEDLVIKPLKNAIKRHALDVAMRNLTIEVSRMGEEAGAVGAATLVLDQVFQMPRMNWPETLG